MRGSRPTGVSQGEETLLSWPPGLSFAIRQGEEAVATTMAAVHGRAAPAGWAGISTLRLKTHLVALGPQATTGSFPSTPFGCQLSGFLETWSGPAAFPPPPSHSQGLPVVTEGGGHDLG